MDINAGGHNCPANGAIMATCGVNLLKHMITSVYFNNTKCNGIISDENT